MFGRLHIPAALPGVREAITQFRPDLVLRETFHYASALGAEEAGVPHVRVAPGMAMVDGVAVEYAVEGFPALAGAVAAIKRSPLLTLAPPSFDGGDPPGVLVRRYRDSTLTAGDDGDEPPWLSAGDGPLVYVTFGSVAARFGSFPELIKSAFGALSTLGARGLVTVGERVDPRQLGEAPSNVRVERWVPQAQVLPHASAILCHGGFGTVLGGLYAGVPMVLVPMFSDQPQNAARVVALGAGVMLEGDQRTGAHFADGLQCVLNDPSYAAATGRVAAEAATLPPAADALELLEQQAR